MDCVRIPEEAANYLGAMLLSFNRDISGHLLDEAEKLASLGLTASAVIIAGTVLEYAGRSPAGIILPAARKSELEGWRRLRDEVAHDSPTRPDIEQVRRMLQGIREIVSFSATAAEPAPQSSGRDRAFAGQVKGKYAHVRTSADEFMKRKREEVELEDRK
jgi:hypothetical protein